MKGTPSLAEKRVAERWPGSVRHPGCVGKRKQRALESLGAAFGAMQALADQRDRDRGVLRLTVMPDYGCSGLWKGRAGGPIAPEDLGLSPELCDACVSGPRHINANSRARTQLRGHGWDHNSPKRFRSS